MLVIIGLLVGGVLVGADLIKVAQIRRAVSNLERISASTNAFRTKYDCIPGDCATATTYFGSTYVFAGWGCSGNGDGNGLIDQWPCESVQALAGLMTSGLIALTPLPNPGAGTGTSIGNLYFEGFNHSNQYFYFSDLYGQTNRIGNSVTMAIYDSGTWISGGALMPSQAEAIDKKIDDGYPLTGAFMGLSSSTAGTWPAGTCVTAGANTYTTTPSLSMGCRGLYFLQ